MTMKNNPNSGPLFVCYDGSSVMSLTGCGQTGKKHTVGRLTDSQAIEWAEAMLLRLDGAELRFSIDE